MDYKAEYNRWLKNVKESDLHDELVVIGLEEAELFEHIARNDDKNVGRSLEQYVSHEKKHPRVCFYL